jgi:predicted secreted protein
MTKQQQNKLNKIQSKVNFYFCAPAYSNATLNSYLFEDEVVMFNVTNPDSPWYEGSISVFGYIKPKGGVVITIDDNKNAKLLLS